MDVISPHITVVRKAVYHGKNVLPQVAPPLGKWLSGIVFLGESLTLAMGMGMLLLFAGIVLAQKG